MGDLFPDDFDETQDQANDIVEVSNTIDFKTKLNFLLTHNGIRKNCMHFLIAPTHAGKSTLTRTLIRDIVFNNQEKKILILLSEETKEQFKKEFYKGVPAGKHLKNVKVSSQVGVNSDGEKIKKEIKEIVEHYNIDIILYDNITTASGLYQDESIGVQSKTITWLKSLCTITTVFCIAHTNTDDFNTRLLSENDIRGGKTAVNMTEFLYVMQPIHVNDSLFQFILIKKHRGQRVENKFFRLNYDPTTMAFANDYAVNFDKVKEIFKLRNRL